VAAPPDPSVKVTNAQVTIRPALDHSGGTAFVSPYPLSLPRILVGKSQPARSKVLLSRSFRESNSPDDAAPQGYSTNHRRIGVGDDDAPSLADLLASEKALILTLCPAKSSTMIMVYE